MTPSRLHELGQMAVHRAVFEPAPGGDLADAHPMRRGSLSERTIKCSKPGCACGQNPQARHGPYFSLTRAVGGKTRSRFLTAEQAERARQQGAEIEDLERGQRTGHWRDSCGDGSGKRPVNVGRPPRTAHDRDAQIPDCAYQPPGN